MLFPRFDFMHIYEITCGTKLANVLKFLTNNNTSKQVSPSPPNLLQKNSTSIKLPFSMVLIVYRKIQVNVQLSGTSVDFNKMWKLFLSSCNSGCICTLMVAAL